MVKIYTILTECGNRYVGSTTDLRSRIAAHRYKSKKNESPFFCKKIACTNVLETCEIKERFVVENKWINFFGINHLLNSGAAGIGVRNVKISKKTRDKISEKSRLLWNTNRDKMVSAINKNRNILHCSKSGKLGSAAKIRNRGKISVYDKLSGSKLHEFDHGKILASFLNVSHSTACRYVTGYLKHNKYTFKLNGALCQ